MRSLHSLTTSILIAGISREVIIEYGFTPGSPERRPDLSSPGEPAEGPEVDVVSVQVNVFHRSPLSGQMLGKWEVAPSWFDAIIQEAVDAEEIDPEQFILEATT